MASSAPPYPPSPPQPSWPPLCAERGFLDFWERLLAALLRGDASLASLAANCYLLHQDLSSINDEMRAMVMAVTMKGHQVGRLASECESERRSHGFRTAERKGCCLCYVRSTAVRRKRQREVEQEAEKINGYHGKRGRIKIAWRRFAPQDTWRIASSQMISVINFFLQR